MAFADWKDGVNFLAGDSLAAFTLLGGRYAFGIAATFGGGTVALQQLFPDGTTYVNAATPLTTSGQQILDLPPGTYKINVVTATNVQGFVARVPYRAA